MVIPALLNNHHRRILSSLMYRAVSDTSNLVRTGNLTTFENKFPSEKTTLPIGHHSLSHSSLLHSIPFR